MSPDPRDFDVILCVALLVGFMGLMPVILSLSIKEWIVVNVMISSNQTYLEETSDIGHPLTNQSSSLNIVSEEYAKNAFKSEQTEEIKLSANFGSICQFNGSSRICLILETINNTSDSAMACFPEKKRSQYIEKKFKDVLECNALLLSHTISSVPRMFSIVLLVTSAITIISTVLLDVIVVFDKDDARIKLMLVTLFAGSGIIEIASVLFFYYTVFLSHQAFGSAYQTIGLTAYLTFANGCVAIIISTLLFISIRWKRKRKLPVFIPDSQTDTPSRQPCVQFEFESSQADIGDIDLPFTNYSKAVKSGQTHSANKISHDVLIESNMILIASKKLQSQPSKVIDSLDKDSDVLSNKSENAKEKKITFVDNAKDDSQAVAKPVGDKVTSIAQDEVSHAISFAKELFQYFDIDENAVREEDSELKGTTSASRSDSELAFGASHNLSEKVTDSILSETELQMNKETIKYASFNIEKTQAGLSEISNVGLDKQNSKQDENTNIVSFEDIESLHEPIETQSKLLPAKEDFVNKSFVDIDDRLASVYHD